MSGTHTCVTRRNVAAPARRCAALPAPF